jgi:hypothetical protein
MTRGAWSFVTKGNGPGMGNAGAAGLTCSPRAEYRSRVEALTSTRQGGHPGSIGCEATDR